MLPHHCVLHDVTATHSQTKQNKKCDDNTDVFCTDAGRNPSPPGRRCCDLTPPVRIIRRGTRHDESASGPPQLHLLTEGRQWGKQAREPSEKPAIFFPLVHTGVAVQFGRKQSLRGHGSRRHMITGSGEVSATFFPDQHRNYFRGISPHYRRIIRWLSLGWDYSFKRGIVIMRGRR